MAGAARPGAAETAPVMKRIVLTVGAWLLVACSAAPSYSPAVSQAPLGPAPEVSVAEAALMQADGAFVLDVREPSEWASGHIPGATLIPLGQLASRLDEVPRDRGVVVVCRTGNRSAQGRDILLGAGYQAVTSMSGGMSAWIAQGRPVETE
jgi:rhodanese-related sulfurtransferase